MYIVLSIVCLCLMAMWAAYILSRIIGNKHEDITIFMRDPSKGKFALIYIISYLMFFTGRLYAGDGIFNVIFGSCGDTLGLIVLKFDSTSVQMLMNDSSLYTATVRICFTLVLVNALLFFFSVLGQYLWLTKNALSFHLAGRRKKRLLIIGCCENSRLIYQSAKEYKAVILDRVDKECAESLYGAKIFYMSCDAEQKIRTILKSLSRTNKEYTVVINTDNNERNMKICGLFADYVSQLEMQKDEKPAAFEKITKNLKVFVFGDEQYETVFLKHEFLGSGVIKYVNKYTLISQDFVNKMPLTSYMDERQIDYREGLIKENADINVFLIGFGRNNRQNFLALTMNNQFLTRRANDGKIVHKPVNYYIFDKTMGSDGANLSHAYHRYEQEFSGKIDPDEYLPLPPSPAKEIYCISDINTSEFYNKIRGLILQNRNGANFLVVSTGSDILNIEVGERLSHRLHDWNAQCSRIFVKVSNMSNTYLGLKLSDLIFIGNEKQTVYNIDRIVNDKLTNMAMHLDSVKLRMMIQETGEEQKEDKKESKKTWLSDWYSKNRDVKRVSSLYGALSIRTQLNLMGLDYIPKGSDPKRQPLSQVEFLEKYAGCELRDKRYYDPDGALSDRLYTSEYPGFLYASEYPDSLRTHLAMQEHMRWNAFMICKGFIPASKEQIRADASNGKNYLKRYHANLTTCDGLLEYRKIVMEKGVSERKADVIKYDFIAMDSVYAYLENNGCSIVKKQPQRIQSL